tara:strand:+ start:135 stop:521 length:387 start_codon:yes stop_codon:yes gene_type:complete
MSTLKADTIQSTGGGAATLTKQSAAKAWIDHTQITTSAIRDSFNISSITDAGTGLTYPIAFTNNMSSSSYCGSLYTASHSNDAYNTFNNDFAGGLGSKTTSSFGHGSFGTSSFVDSLRNDDVIFGDLA